MQLAVTAPVPGPIGVTSYGTMRVGHALNGIAYSEHKLLGPITGPLATYTGSLQDAVAGAQKLLQDLELAGRLDARPAVALLGTASGWVAQRVYADDTVLRAIDLGPGRGGIASITFPEVARSLGALVTSGGSLLPGELRG